MDKDGNFFVLMDYFKLLRPRQWTKNLIVFAALIFSKNLFDLTLVIKEIMTFFVFCLLSSAIYIFNDICDREQDRLHPLKKNRPLASGKAKVVPSLVMAVVFLTLCLLWSLWIHIHLLWIVFGYLALQISYSIYLKRVVLWDVIVIAIGFVLRAVAGAVSIGVLISDWLLLCAFLLALFLGFCKRRQELVIFKDSEVSSFRRVLDHYSASLLDALISVVTGTTVIAYAIYTVWPDTVQKFGTHRLLYTLPFVVYGIFRYLYLVHQEDKGDSPTRVLLTDLWLQLNLLAWLITSVLILYFAA